MNKKIVVYIILLLVVIVLTIYLFRKPIIKMSDSKKTKGGINNPGNIRTSAIKWVGKVTKETDSFESFDTLENGIRAMYKLLLTYRNKYGLDTVSEIINRWAPPSENNTAGYVNFVSAKMGVTPTQYLNLSQYPSLVSAMSKQEGNYYVSTNDVAASIINIV